MRATIEWSYNLLAQPERRMFERLSVFAGGCTIDMAIAVCSEGGPNEPAILDLLSSLVDKSLVTSDVGADETRCLLLETTRQYAREQLAERGESEPTAERHARALLDVARDIAENHATYNARLDRSPAVLRTMRAERANFDEALHWTLGRRANVRLGQELAWRIPFLRAADGLRWLRLALDAVGEGTPRELVAQMETQLGWCYIDVRDLHNAIATARRAVAAGRDHGDARTVAAAQRLLGRALAHAWNLDEAEVELRHSLSSFRELEDRRAIATTLSYLAFVAVRRGAHLQARRLNLEALDALGDGDERTARLIKIELARAEYGLGNYSVALALSRDVLPGLEAEAAEGGLTCVILMLNQCTFLLALDRFDDAANVARRALAATLDVQNPRPDLAPYVAGAIAKVAVLNPGASGPAERAIRLQGCARLIGWYEAVCAARGESDPEEALEELSMLRRELGAARVAALWSEGAGLDHRAAVDLMQSL